MLEEFAGDRRPVDLPPPKIPVVSNVTGAARRRTDRPRSTGSARPRGRPLRRRGPHPGDRASQLPRNGPRPGPVRVGATRRTRRRPACCAATARGDAARRRRRLHAAARPSTGRPLFAGTGARGVAAAHVRLPAPPLLAETPRTAVTRPASGLAPPPPAARRGRRRRRTAAVLLTGRLSLAAHPWLADHVIAGRAPPRYGALELALAAVGRRGCDRRRRPHAPAPLVRPGRRGPSNSRWPSSPRTPRADRALHIHARPTTRPTNCPGRCTRRAPSPTPRRWREPWTCAPGRRRGGTARPEGLYEWFGRGGTLVRPGFRGMEAVWHPGTTGSAGHAARRGRGGGEGSACNRRSWTAPACPGPVGAGRRRPVAVPVVGCGAVGRGRVLSPRPRDAARRGHGRTRVADGNGEPLATIDSLLLRPVTLTEPEATAPRPRRAVPSGVASPHRARRGPNGRLECPRRTPGRTDSPVRHVVRGPGRIRTALDTGTQPPSTVLLPIETAARSVRETVTEALDTLKEWLREPRLSGTRLLTVLSGPADHEEPLTDPAAAAVRGLIRTASAETRAAVALADLDLDSASWETLAGVPETHSEVLVRRGTARVPRLARMAGR